MRALLCTVVLAATLTACSSEIKDAERELSIIEKAGASRSELCRAKQKVANAYLRAHDEEGYKFSKTLADSACLNADIHERFLNL